MPDHGADDQRARRPDPHPAAGPRRLRRGHPRRRTAGRPEARADRLRRRAAGDLLPPRGRLGRHHLGRGAKKRGYEMVTATYDLAGNGRAQILKTAGAVTVVAEKDGPVLGVHMVGERVGELDRRGPADLQLGGVALRGRRPHPPPPHAVRSGRRGPPRARRQAPAQPQLAADSHHQHRPPLQQPTDEGGDDPMPVSVTMPRLGESVSEGTVTRWLKKEGERVEADEPLLEVSTDKVDTEIPAPASGVLTLDQGRRGRDRRSRRRAGSDRRERRRRRRRRPPQQPSRGRRSRRAERPAAQPQPASAGGAPPAPQLRQPAPARRRHRQPLLRQPHAAARAGRSAGRLRPRLAATTATVRTSLRWYAGSPPSTTSTCRG